MAEQFNTPTQLQRLRDYLDGALKRMRGVDVIEADRKLSGAEVAQDVIAHPKEGPPFLDKLRNAVAVIKAWQSGTHPVHIESKEKGEPKAGFAARYSDAVDAYDAAKELVRDAGLEAASALVNTLTNAQAKFADFVQNEEKATSDAAQAASRQAEAARNSDEIFRRIEDRAPLSVKSNPGFQKHMTELRGLAATSPLQGADDATLQKMFGSNPTVLALVKEAVREGGESAPATPDSAETVALKQKIRELGGELTKYKPKDIAMPTEDDFAARLDAKPKTSQRGANER